MDRNIGGNEKSFSPFQVRDNDALMNDRYRQISEPAKLRSHCLKSFSSQNVKEHSCFFYTTQPDVYFLKFLYLKSDDVQCNGLENVSLTNLSKNLPGLLLKTISSFNTLSCKQEFSHFGHLRLETKGSRFEFTH